MLSKVPDLPHDELLRLLRYDPETGDFTWRVAASKRTKAGDRAGSFTPHGYYLVTLHGTGYYGHYLAWFYVHGVWPDGDPLFRDADRSNLALANLDFTRRYYSDTSSAIAARKFRSKRKKQLKARVEDRDSPIPDITRNRALRRWTVHLPGRPNAVIGEAGTFEKAAEIYFARLRGIEYVSTHLPPATVETDLDLHAGGDTAAVTFLEVHTWLAYDPDTGHFYHRRRHSRASHPKHQPQAPYQPPPARGSVEPPRDNPSELVKGERADVLNSNGSPVVKLFGRDYPAHMMAVFMQTRVWPKRRSVKHRDNDKTNNAWANIYVMETAPK